MKSKDKGNEPWRQPELEAVIYLDKFGRKKALTPFKDRVRDDEGLLIPFLWAFLF
jgi:hypothetical protein